MKCIKAGNTATILLDDGSMLVLSPFSQEDLEFMLTVPSEEQVKERFLVEFRDYFKASNKIDEVKKKVSEFDLLEFEDGKVTIPSISKVGVPENLVNKILEARWISDNDALEGYLNFWRLLCQNPNAEARNNLLWFLEKYNFSILKSGLFVGYRSVVSKNIYETDYKRLKSWKKSPKKYSVIKTSRGREIKKTSKITTETVEGNLYDLYHNHTEVFTDSHTNSFTIRLGEPVRMRRADCDERSDQTCSSGLHLATKDWGSLESFGDTILMCLCNPQHVVAVPTKSDYGKLRTCEYFPIKIYTRGEDSLPDGTELDYFDISYDEPIYETDGDVYKLVAPKKPTLKTPTNLNVEEIKEQLRQRNVK